MQYNILIQTVNEIHVKVKMHQNLLGTDTPHRHL